MKAVGKGIYWTKEARSFIVLFVGSGTIILPGKDVQVCR